MRRDIPEIQQKKRVQNDLKNQGTHTVRIDKDGDIIMEEWTKCIYCVTELSRFVF